MKLNSKNIFAITILSLVIGGVTGYLLRQPAQPTDTSTHEHSESSIDQIWTCSMHPQIRQNEPGDCPICGMDLVPLESEQGSELDPMAIRMSPTAMLLANVSTTLVGSMNPEKSVRLNGKVQADERLVYSQSSHIPGRIEKLMVNFTGEYVSKGTVIAYIYSPDLVTAQEELFEAQKIKETQPQLFQAAIEKLKNWKLSDSQIEQILQAGASKETFAVRADVSGYVTLKKVNLGDYIRKGEPIYQIADLSKVWVLFDVYESDMSWVKKGDQVDFTIASLPGETFKGTISYLDPVIDPETRVAKARVEVDNRKSKLKPEMFVSGIVAAKIPQKPNNIVVPKTAVMWTGKRSVVYVKSETDYGISFIMREVTLGPALGESFVIESGLQEGDEIAVNGTFSIDAAAQLAGKPSMMSPEGGPAMTGHNHGEVNLPESKMSEISEVEKTYDVNEKFKSQLTAIYQAYLPVKDALVESNAIKTQKLAMVLKDRLNKVNMELVKGEAHNKWMQYLKPLQNAVDKMVANPDLTVQRKALIPLTNNLFKGIKTFAVSGISGYYQFCPMADNDNGAYWLSSEDDIKNPYFGDAMLTCGEVVETIGNVQNN